jgi:predicted lysophospholipase L1 biosynthesis ABC-type transport system permease subunit
MGAGVIGVTLALLLEKSFSQPVEHARPAGQARTLPTAAAVRFPEKPVDEKTLLARRAAYRLGNLVFVGLAILTAVEFILATVGGGSVVLLFLVGLIKAGLIIQYYMHLRSVWGEEAHG